MTFSINNNSDIIKKALPFAFFGNALEFYEFTVYAIFAPMFAKDFFVTDSETLSLMYSWAAFAVAFFTRPIGAFVFGYIGDKLGRKIALSFSILTMACATLSIGLLPNYHESGIFAPIMLIFLRLVQGISTGGEYNGAAIYLIEKFQYKNPGLVGGIATSSCVLGALAGTIFGGWCQMHDLWRVAFIAGGIFGVILFFLRFMLTESLAFSKKMTDEKAKSINVGSTKYVFKFIANMLIGGLNGAFSYTLFGFSIFYLKKYLGYSASEAFTLNIIGMVAYFICNLLFGYICDKVGSKLYWKVVLVANAVIVGFTFHLIIGGGQLHSLLGILLLGMQSGSISGPCHSFLQENIVPEIRYRFVSVSFASGMALIGGTTPVVLTFLVDKHHLLYAPFYWIASISLISLIMIQITNKKWAQVSQ